MRTSPRPAEIPPEIDPELDEDNGEFDFSGLPRGVRHPGSLADPDSWAEVPEVDPSERLDAIRDGE